MQATFVNIWRWLGVAAFGCAVALLAYKVVQFDSPGWLALDFKLEAAQRLVDGRTLYPPGTSGAYPYPPIWAMLASPLLLLPSGAAPYVASALCVAAMLGALWIIGLRDPFCYAAALVSGPVVSNAQLGNASAFVMLLVALGYRLNAAPIGLAVAIKLYAWPLLVWSAMRRGIRDFAIGIAVALLAIFVPWAAIGFDGITRYLSVAHDVTANQPTYALPTALGVAVAAFALGAMWIGRADPVGSFSFAILAMLASTPVLWDFYFAAVLLPLALRRPRFSAAWLVPFLLTAVHGDAHTIAFMGLLVWCGVGAPAYRILAPKRACPDT